MHGEQQVTPITSLRQEHRGVSFNTAISAEEKASN